MEESIFVIYVDYTQLAIDLIRHLLLSIILFCSFVQFFLKIMLN